jgi:hypothetical protein
MVILLGASALCLLMRNTIYCSGGGSTLVVEIPIATKNRYKVALAALVRPSRDWLRLA